MIHSAVPVNWHHRLFEATLPEERDALQMTQAAMGVELRNEAHAFLDTFVPGAARNQASSLDRWYHSEAGQAELVRLVDHIWSVMSAHAAHAMPAHDARHAIHKVPADAVEHMHAEGVAGWERVGLLGALLHDYGRWAEERFFGGPGVSANHSRMSFVLARDILDGFDLPQPVQDHILFAVLSHTKGAVASDPMVTKITVAADRVQLYGPERMLRQLHHSIDPETGDDALIYGPPGSRSVTGQLEKYLGTRILGPLFARIGHFSKLWRQSYQFCILADNTPEAHARLKRIIENQKTMPRPLKGVDFEEFASHARSKASIATHVLGDMDAFAMTCKFLDLPHLAPNLQYKQQALDKLRSVSPERQVDLANALRYMHQCLIHENKRQTDELVELGDIYRHNDDSFVCRVIDLVKMPS
jgi:hypothetical protein